MPGIWLKLNLFLAFSYFLLISAQEETKIEKLTPDSFDENEIWEIGEENNDRARKKLKHLNYDEQLVQLAQKESEKLANLGKLRIPKISISKSYAGYAYKITGVLNDNYSS